VSSSDAQRSNAFYQRLFGVGIRSYQGRTAPTMAVGPGVEFLMNSGRNAAERPLGIHHFCLTLKDFDPERVVAALERFGLKPRESRNRPAGPLRHYITMRMEDRGGAKEGTPELYFTDPDGLLVQLQDVSYCGGSGVLGNVCS
jgi:catechol 2,3-dioxygenase-like lactoylglutathione lyase family enzyme